MAKKCTKCKETKDEGEFSKDKSRGDGLDTRCRVCVREYYQANRVAFIEQAYLRYKRNPESNRKSKIRYRAANREKTREYNRRWHQANREKSLEKDHRRRARKLNSGGSFTQDEWQALCSYYGNKCLCCKEPKPLTVDHVIPISKGGTSDISNLQPLCKSCNSRKGQNIFDYR